MNEYVAELGERTVKQNNKWKNKRNGEVTLRRELVEKYSWAIPDKKSINKILSVGDNIIELGSGTGYWSHLIERNGGTITPIDPVKADNQWTDVINEDHMILENNKEFDTLLLCWPSFSALWPKEAVEMFDGETIIYIGEGRGGNTGSEEFHRTLSENYGLADEVIDIPSWQSVDDRMFIFRSNY